MDIVGVLPLPSPLSSSHCQKRVTAVTPTVPTTVGSHHSVHPTAKAKAYSDRTTNIEQNSTKNNQKGPDMRLHAPPEAFDCRTHAPHAAMRCHQYTCATCAGHPAFTCSTRSRPSEFIVILHMSMPASSVYVSTSRQLPMSAHVSH